MEYPGSDKGIEGDNGLLNEVASLNAEEEQRSYLKFHDDPPAILMDGKASPLIPEDSEDGQLIEDLSPSF